MEFSSILSIHPSTYRQNITFVVYWCRNNDKGSGHLANEKNILQKD